jgi:hypothetical protein
MAVSPSRVTQIQHYFYNWLQASHASPQRSRVSPTGVPRSSLAHVICPLVEPTSVWFQPQQALELSCQVPGQEQRKKLENPSFCWGMLIFVVVFVLDSCSTDCEETSREQGRSTIELAITAASINIPRLFLALSLSCSYRYR